MGENIKDIKNPFAIVAIIRFATGLVRMAIKKQQEEIEKKLKGE